MYIYAWMYVCVCVCVCMHACIYIYMNVCMHACVCMYVCVCVHVCMFACMHVCVYIYICMCVYVCMCVYACKCVYECMYICMCVQSNLKYSQATQYEYVQLITLLTQLLAVQLAQHVRALTDPNVDARTSARHWSLSWASSIDTLLNEHSHACALYLLLAPSFEICWTNSVQ
jgi:hypothetical protein